MTRNKLGSRRLSTVKRENLILGIGAAIQGIPFFVTDYDSQVFARFYYPHYEGNLLLLLACLPVLILIELSMILFLIAGAKYCASAASSKIIVFDKLFLFIVAFVVVLYHALIGVSWYYYSQTGFFLGYETLRLFPMLLDFRYVVGTFSLVKILELLGIVAASILLGCWIVASTPARSFRGFIAQHGRGTVLAILMATALVAVSHSYLNGVFAGIYRANSFFALSPQWSLFWAYIRYGEFEPRLPSVALNLVERKEAAGFSTNQLSGKHVFLFVVEALRADAVDQVLTPTLHRLAHEGISFANSYSQSSETSESMLSIITGRYPLRSRLRDRGVGEKGVFHVYDEIGRAGYLTGYFGEEWSEDTSLTNSPFLNYRFNPLVANYSKIALRDNPFNYKERGLGDYSLAVADRLKMKMLESFVSKGTGEGKKLFSILYFMSSHFPYDQVDGIPTLRLPNELNGDYSFLSYPRHLAPIMRNRYLNTIAYVDSLINVFLGFLQQQNQLANSIIIITGDHGEGFLEHNRVAHSRHLDQEAVRVPLIIWGANEYVPRWQPTVPVGHVDIAPTIYYLLGLPEHPSFQGEIVVKPRAASDLESTPDRPLFLSIQALMHEDAMILWPWKIVRNLWGEGLRVYRLDTDPEETNNLRNIDAASARKLCTCLVGFRAAQLDYYDPLKELERRYYPPKYRTCDDISVKGLVEFCELR